MKGNLKNALFLQIKSRNILKEYHEKDNYKRLVTLRSIAETYRNMGKFLSAINIFNQIKSHLKK